MREGQKRIGKELRKQIARSSHGEWSAAPDRPDPISLLQEQDRDRIQELIPIKYGRMAASPFAFLRGSAVVMAADLAHTPVTGLEVQLCGDAHLANFGVFASPERKLVFDINDFDESYPGPWEWDLQRLAASAVVAGRDNGLEDRLNQRMARAVSTAYAESMALLAKANTLDVWYFHIDSEDVLEAFERTTKKSLKSARKMVSKARTKTQEQTLEKLTRIVDGRRSFASEPPLLVPIDELLTEDELELVTIQHIDDMWAQYLDSLSPDKQQLLSRYRLRDAALRVGGVGSVGTRCTILLLVGGSEDDAIILQLKEAGASVIESYSQKSMVGSPAERVVQGQQLMQATSDIFLGWHESSLTSRNYYWRQLKDMKGSLDIADLDEKGYETYLKVCAVCLARAHARSGDAAAISGYIGNGKALARGITEFAMAYADQTERDHQNLLEAIRSGRVVSEPGI